MHASRPRFTIRLAADRRLNCALAKCTPGTGWPNRIRAYSSQVARFVTVACLLVITTRFAHADSSIPAKPNILVMVSDNQGWKDVGYNGSEIRTPHLDNLAATGVRLDQFYVYPMCSPTRAAMVSGRAPSRFGIVGAIGHRSRQALPVDTITIADALKTQGYDTAISGKWHLGLRPETGPLQYGFNHSYGYLHGQIDKYSHLYKNGDQTWHRNDQFLNEKGHALDLITAEAIRLIEAERDQPFFLYVPFCAPHTPLQEEEKWIRPYEQEIEELSRRQYAATITHLDQAVGDILAALERSGQREKTLVVFFSDNGAVQSLGRRAQDYQDRFGPYPRLGDNGPLRGWLGELYDGCLRTPAVVNWPGVLKPQVVDRVTSVLDWFPTLLGRAGGQPAPDWQLEGRDIWPLLTGAKELPAPVLYWKTSAGKAVREGSWKLVDMPRHNSVELFRMDRDPYEQNNLSARYPERVEHLRQLIKQQSALDVGFE